MIGDEVVLSDNQWFPLSYLRHLVLFNRLNVINGGFLELEELLLS
jgi:hypothetical protein